MIEGTTPAADAELRREIAEGFADLGRKIAQNGKMLRVLQEVIVHGAGERLPWQRLSPARMRQVQGVVDFLREHPCSTIRNAAKRTFSGIEGGYADAENLASYCYDHNVKMFV